MQVNDVKQLEKNIQEGLSCLFRIESEKELLTTIIETSAEKNGIDKKVVRKLIATAYKKATDLSKYNDEKELFEDVFGIVDNLNL